MKRLNFSVVFIFAIIVTSIAGASDFRLTNVQSLLPNDRFQSNDGVLVMQGDKTVYQWQADEALIPASLTKIVSAQLAIDKWGLDHRFHTDFYQLDDTLWVKGYGDPFLISEEIDLLVKQLQPRLSDKINKIAIDASYFEASLNTPGRSKVVDPYNAPLSAVAANFNTAMLSKKQVHTQLLITSAETQTPLTNTAKRIASKTKFTKKTQRINLDNANNAQQHFAEILGQKLNQSGLEILINASLPQNAVFIYRHFNGHDLEHVLRGALEYSNNFIANQVFIKLADESLLSPLSVPTESSSQPLSFSIAQSKAGELLNKRFNWPNSLLEDGAGLSRENRLSARQIDQVLRRFAPHKNLLKQYEIGPKRTIVNAKTGTLNGVRSFAGYIDLAIQTRFVFLFNRNTPWRYREQLLERLIVQLTQSQRDK